MSYSTPEVGSHLSPPDPDEGKIDLAEIFMILWSGKFVISAVTAGAAIFSVLLALSLPNIYTASALLAPAENSGGGLSGLSKEYGGLASLAGVSLPSGEEGSRTQLGMQLMKSRSFISDFIERHDILPALMAVEEWDSRSGDLIFDDEVYDVASQTWVRDVKSSKLNAVPSMQEAHRVFLGLLGVSQDNQTGYVTVSIEHQSPIVAAEWVNWLVTDINAVVKAQDVAEATNSIEYLTRQAAATPLADLQVVFFELIQSQTETVMLAEVRPEYVFKVIDPAVVPEVKSKPSRALICILGTLLGAMLGIFIVISLDILGRGRSVN